ncbi:MAG: hypothetical protein ABIJ09_03030 [Pseudomonadota bacterium]
MSVLLGIIGCGGVPSSQVDGQSADKDSGLVGDPDGAVTGDGARDAFTLDGTADAFALDGAAVKDVPCNPDNDNPTNSTDIVTSVQVQWDPETSTWSEPDLCTWACDSGYCEQSGQCISSKSVLCDPNNNNPANSTDVAADVTVTCQPNGFFSAPEPCAWQCDTSYCVDGEQCLTSKSVPCDTNNGNPASSTDVTADVTVTCQPDGTFDAPQLCAWTCDTSTCLDGDQCLASTSVSCDGNNGSPANSTDVAADVTVTCQPDGTFAAPQLCSWACDTNYCAEGDLCLGSKNVPCDANNANPVNSTDVTADVTVTCLPEGTFAAPQLCAWACNATYCADGDQCATSKDVLCDSSGSPLNSTSTPATVVVTCQPDGTFDTPAACAWDCNEGFCVFDDQCLSSANVPCDTDNANPADSSDQITNVAVACLPDGSFTAPSDCAWTCNPYYCLEGGSCLSQKSVPCDTNNANPPNSTDVIANVNIACSGTGTWNPPAQCAWACNSNYCQEGNTCVKKIDLDVDGVMDCTQNLVTNGHFNVNTVGWVNSTWSQIARMTIDGQGDTSSGSGRVSHTYNPGAVIGVTQCIPVSPSTTYTVTAQYYVPSGQPATPGAGFAPWSYSNTTCTGNRDLVDCSGNAGTACNSPTWTGSIDTWTTVSHTFTTSPTARAVNLRLNVMKSSGTTAAQYVYYDNVLLH